MKLNRIAATALLGLGLLLASGWSTADRALSQSSPTVKLLESQGYNGYPMLGCCGG